MITIHCDKCKKKIEEHFYTIKTACVHRDIYANTKESSSRTLHLCSECEDKIDELINKKVC